MFRTRRAGKKTPGKCQKKLASLGMREKYLLICGSSLHLSLLSSSGFFFLAMAANIRTTPTSPKSRDSDPRFGGILVVLWPSHVSRRRSAVKNRCDRRHVGEVELRQVGEAIIRTAFEDVQCIWVIMLVSTCTSIMHVSIPNDARCA